MGNLFFADVQFDEDNAEILRDPGFFGWELSAGLRWSLYQHLNIIDCDLLCETQRVCTDPEGADRAAIHAQVLSATVEHLMLN